MLNDEFGTVDLILTQVSGTRTADRLARYS